MDLKDITDVNCINILIYYLFGSITREALCFLLLYAHWKKISGQNRY